MGVQSGPDTPLSELTLSRDLDAASIRPRGYLGRRTARVQAPGPHFLGTPHREQGTVHPWLHCPWPLASGDLELAKTMKPGALQILTSAVLANLVREECSSLTPG